MKQLIFILGGARSGKSRHAVKLAKELGDNVVFIATASGSDKEMNKRIELHKASRPREWALIEEGKDIGHVLSTLSGEYEVVLIDCVGLLVSNLLADNLEDEQIEDRIRTFIDAAVELDASIIIVSNEVGSGMVPMSLVARRFRDLLGLSNQMIAQKADKVVLVRAGIPATIKG